MGLTAAELVRGTVELVSLPEALVRLNALVEDPRSTTEQIARVIETDSALTARLLRIVNSPFYGFPSRVESVRQAVSLVGMREIRDLALATVVARVFEGIPPELMDMERFWRHSLLTGLVARELARHRRDGAAESRFVAGLLHDVGKLLLARQLPELARHALARATYERIPLPEAEREALGFDHAEVGGALLEAWRLPEPLVVAARWHHAPELAPDLWREDALVTHVANVMAHRDEPPPAPPQPLLAEDPWGRLGLDEAAADELLARAAEGLDAAHALLFGA